ncbi:phosphotransferase enzyme family protein [Sedimentitalea sp. XS_ASV28]|uniref:phosphotransferase enzyme family protein n=1 Tax=Sedimentitalea sp. XS_ASV28 TaxID=3241296 RepID=UPI00351254C8
MQGAEITFIAARENRVYRVEHAGRQYALRLHRQGYRSDAELRSELDWMAAVARGGLVVPAPFPSDSGALLHVIQGVQVDMLSWLPGRPLGDMGHVPDRPGLFRALGRDMARLHEVSDAWPRPDGFVRCNWDRAGLLGEAPLWDRFWENPDLSDQDRTLFETLRKDADATLKHLENDLDYGLIHADLVVTNVMTDGTQVAFIDFDDGGFGFRLFELATALLRQMSEPDYAALRDALIGGYRSVRAIDTTPLDLFLVLRAMTYVGWNITRMDEDGGKARNARFISTARTLAETYLREVGGR